MKSSLFEDVVHNSTEGEDRNGIFLNVAIFFLRERLLIDMLRSYDILFLG